MGSQQQFQRLIRLTDDRGDIYYGDLPLDVPTDKIEGSSVKVLEGDIHDGLTRTSKQVRVGKV